METEASKFGLLLLGKLRIENLISSTIDLSTSEVPITAYLAANNVRGKVSSLLQEDNNPWRSWLGDVIWERIKNPKIVVEARIPTETPEEDDQESKIKDELGKVALALQITTAVAAKSRFLITGTEGNGQINVWSYDKLADWIPPSLKFLPGEKRFPFYYGYDPLDENASIAEDDEIVLLHFAECHCHKWKDVFQALCKVDNKDSTLVRLKNGLECFKKACSEGFIDFRLPNFVRSLEALVVPSNGKQFVKMVARWWPELSLLPTSQEERKSPLKKIWDLRSAYVHMKPTASKWTKEDVLSLSFECEAVARKAYQDVLLNPSTLDEVKKRWQEKERDMLSIKGRDK
jgi:hypothetical protein